MLAVRPARLPRRVVTWGPGFLIPRPNGEVWVGATFEDAGFASRVTVEGLHALASHVERLAPALSDAPVTRAWAGLRPLRRDGGPVIGRPRGLANVLVALGHFRNGILLAPVTAHAVRALADGTDVPAEARPFTIA
jgi:glycine oxidase